MATKPKVKQIDWAAWVRKQQDYKRNDPAEYTFSSGRKFERGEKRGVYAP